MTTEVQVPRAPRAGPAHVGAAPSTPKCRVRMPAAGRVVVSVVFLCLALSTSGCGPGAEGPPTTFDSAFAREYSRLHGDTDPNTLSAAPATEAEVAAALRVGTDVDAPLLLPDSLPPGFVLAAPFRGTGSGAALPNPHTWGDGYAVTYTDGRARLTVMVNPDEPVDGGAWQEAAATLQGRPLSVQERDGLVLVSTAPETAGPTVVVVGERVDRATVLAVAESLRRPREP